MNSHLKPTPRTRHVTSHRNGRGLGSARRPERTNHGVSVNAFSPFLRSYYKYLRYSAIVQWSPDNGGHCRANGSAVAMQPVAVFPTRSEAANIFLHDRMYILGGARLTSYFVINERRRRRRRHTSATHLSPRALLRFGRPGNHDWGGRCGRNLMQERIERSGK